MNNDAQSCAVAWGKIMTGYGLAVAMRRLGWCPSISRQAGVDDRPTNYLGWVLPGVAGGLCTVRGVWPV